jgi:hypothetical protein
VTEAARPALPAARLSLVRRFATSGD